VLMNYFALTPGLPARLHFTDEYWVDRQIADRESGKPKWVKSHVFWIDEINGEPAARTFSVLSEKLDAHLKPFLADKKYTLYDFIITEMGTGFLKDWNFQPILRPK